MLMLEFYTQSIQYIFAFILWFSNSRFELAFYGTICGIAISCILAFVNGKWISANKTIFSYKVFRTTLIRLRLACPIFRIALPRTHCRISVSPCYKFLTAPFTSKYGFLRWIGVSIIAIRAYWGTKFSRAVYSYSKFVATLMAFPNTVFRLYSAFPRTKSRWFTLFTAIVDKYFMAYLTTYLHVCYYTPKSYNKYASLP